MLARGNTDAAKRLRRAKSTTSVPRRFPTSKFPPVNCDTTKQHALTAANIAFEKAKTIPIDVTQAIDQRTLARNRYSRKSFEGSRVLRHKPSRTKTSPSKHRGKDQHEQRPKSMCHLTPISQRASFLQSEKSSTLGNGYTPDTEDIRFADRFDGYGVPAPAGYREAQSFTGLGYRNESPRILPLYSSYRPPVFIDRGSTTPAVREYQTDEAIIALARDRYLQDHQPQPLKQRHSFISHSLRSRLRKSDRFSRQVNSVMSQDRPSIESRELDSSSSPNDTRSKPQQSPKPKRHSTVFESVKKSWRKAMGRSTSTGSAELPPQQVQSKYAHYRRPTAIEDDNNLFYSFPCHTDTDDWAFQKPPTPPPHLEGVGLSNSATQFGREIPQSSESTDEERSRVTSWNDSTRQSTLISKDVDHLPSIQEGNEIQMNPNYALLNEKESNVNGSRKSSSRFSLKQGIDSRRLVSAIMKHTRKTVRGIHKTNIDFEDNKRYFGSNDGSQSIVASQKSPEEAFAEQCDYVSEFQNRPVDLLAPQSMNFSQNESSSDIQPPPRSEVMSPSIYSERQYAFPNDSTSSVERTHSPAGTARVLASEAVTKWQVGGGREQRYQSTSSEWRSWAAEKFAGLDSLENLALSKLGPQSTANDPLVLPSRSNIATDTISDARETSSSEKYSTSRTLSTPSAESPAIDQRESREGVEKQQLRSLSRQLSLMNDRFPLLNSGRSMSKSSILSSKRIYSPDFDTLETTQAEFPVIKEATDPSPEPMERCEQETGKSGNEEKSDSKKQPRRARWTEYRASRLSPVPRSTNSNPQLGKQGQTTPLSTRRQNHLDENFLLRIRRGPYNTSTTSIDKGANESIESIVLPKRRSPATKSKSKENAPTSTGQRMAKEFLDQRAHKQAFETEELESSPPAFI